MIKVERVNALKKGKIKITHQVKNQQDGCGDLSVYAVNEGACKHEKKCSISTCIY